MDTATGAQDNFRKSMFPHQKRSPGLYHTEGKPFINVVQKKKKKPCGSLWTRTHLRGREKQWKPGRWSERRPLSLFLERKKADVRSHMWVLKKTSLLIMKGAKASICDGRRERGDPGSGNANARERGRDREGEGESKRGKGRGREICPWWFCPLCAL